MRKFLILILMSFSISSFGQVSFGLKAGLNVNDIGLQNTTSLDIEKDYKMNVGYHVGVYSVINIGKKFAFIPEFQFSQRGGHVSNGVYDFRTNLNYLEMPLILSYSATDRLGIDLGPSIAVKLSAVAKGDGYKNNIDYWYDQNFDFGMNGGLRFRITKRISVVGRYYWGLVPIDETNYRDANNNLEGTVKYYNRTIQLTLIYKIK